ncbi:unnamed protein product [Brassica rapa]|uniref:Replication protein A 70 kDa DNA-binding subunit B/D first OB fold domain-containing protein n=1 Tax=Brassica campestris TaxID=3711 RepID=A0A8D9CU76_BRACM|nr:unnamed protein product [Brassica rapa]
MASSPTPVVNAAAAAAVGNPTKNGEFMGITILLLDELDSVIHGFIPANRANHYRSSLKTGSIVRLDRFDVARVGHTYKITEHQYVIRFIPSTRVVEVQTDAPVIKMDKFMVRRYEQLQVLANTSLELPDVVGEIKSVQGSDLKNQTARSRVVVRLLIEPNMTVFMSLWDEAASAFRGLLKAGDKSQSVMLVTTVNPKLFGGNLYLNSTQGTRFFFDTSISEIAEFVSSIGATPPQDYTCVDTLERVKKKELVSIGDLNTFISNSNEQVSNGGEEYLPSCLEELSGKEFVFQIRVTPFNFTPNHRTFTVATISEASEVTHSENSGIDTGLEASSSGPSVLGVKISEERASGNNPGNEGAQQRRKRGRE